MPFGNVMEAKLPPAAFANRPDIGLH